jgi:hypothetical protein
MDSVNADNGDEEVDKIYAMHLLLIIENAQ